MELKLSENNIRFQHNTEIQMTPLAPFGEKVGTPLAVSCENNALGT